ncbi:MAG TPA: ribonuclease H-like domain-containing protein [Candidatus Limnocylindrales bacterium]|nr:ribonuclease H-like domain-containing protein [Candidatus Limnocylindrales bacterium]
MTTDLRARIALVVARDRARHARDRTADSDGIDRNPLYVAHPVAAATGSPAPRGPSVDASSSAALAPALDLAATPTPDASFARSGARLEVREKRIAVDDLGLEIVGRGACDPLLLAHLGLKGEAPRDWSDILFLDTETTGLSGGTGTYVFLIGLAYLRDGELVLRQHLLRDIGAEREFVEHLKRELEPFRACASYNGKTFDLPLLRTRFVMAMRSELTVDESHLDLLHPARRLWKNRFGSTTLRQLEESVLDDGRITDIPGSLIPDAYFHYLRKGDEKIIAPVLEHNARDVISLVRIADHVARAVLAARSGQAPSHAPAAFALARGFERTGELEAAFWCYESAYYDGDNELRVRLSLLYARALERRGEVVRVVRMLETLLALGLGSPRWREQAEARIRRLVRRKKWQAATATTS